MKANTIVRCGKCKTRFLRQGEVIEDCKVCGDGKEVLMKEVKAVKKKKK